MGNYASSAKLDQLKLVEGEDAAPPAQATGAPAPPVTPAVSAGAAEGQDFFMIQAAREFEKGQVEQPIWARAMAQAGGNVAAAKPVYLRARAVALRLEQRDKGGDASPARDRSSRSSSASATETAARRGSSSRRSGTKWQPPGKLDRKRIAMAAGALAAIAAIAGFLVVRTGGAPPASQATAGAAVPSGVSATRAGNPQKSDAPAGPDFARKIQEFKDAGNWNVLVLYAVEWTRKEPANWQAWKELGGGYLRMRQFDDALEATRKAVQMAPGDAELWQNLGQINVALRQPAAALTAFERASELNERDVTSRVQAGALNLELGHLPQARDAFASALAINPLDVEALCGAATVARKEGRARDADAVARQVKSGGAECREPEPPPSASVAAASPASKKPLAPRAR